MKKLYLTKDRQREKVFLVITDLKKRYTDWVPEEIEDEMKELVIACGGEVVDSMIARLDVSTANYLVTEGRAKDIAALASMKKVDTVIFSLDLKGSQQRNLEKIIKAKTIDRTQLILDIFARRAQSREGKMQVELAQLEYLLPRLVGKGIELSRLGGGIGTLGPGETKLEVDRRRISQRIDKLKAALKNVSANRLVQKKKRHEQGVPSVSLVGYTNAGKSTLLNKLTGAHQITKDGLFTTLDSLSRQYVLPNHQKAVLSDTVGFMHDLPHRLIESFKATLEQVVEADLLLHVVDVSHRHFRHFHQSVLTVLQELKAEHKPIITIFNKMDLVEHKFELNSLNESFKPAISISAKTGENLDKLNSMIMDMLATLITEINVYVPIGRMDLVNLAHEQGEVYSVKYYDDLINIRASVPVKIAALFRGQGRSVA